MNKLIIFFFGYMGALSAQNLSSQLTACYPFDGNSQNAAVTGTTLDGVVSNVSYGVGHTGTVNTAIQFAGNTGSYVKLPSNSLIKPNQVSVSGWYYSDLVQDTYVIYTANSCSSNDEAYSLVYKSNCFLAEIASGVNFCNRAEVFSANVTPNAWYHVVFSIDNSMVKLYVNGTLTSVAHNLAWDYLPGANVVIANSLNPALQSSFRGRIDNLRFYNRILTQAEVNLLYASDPSCESTSEPVTDISEVGNTMNIFPNPASGNFTITGLDMNEDFFMRVVDYSGRVLQTSMGTANFNVSDLKEGLYHVELLDKSGKIFAKKLVIK
jgi:hypothetical protein